MRATNTSKIYRAVLVFITASTALAYASFSILRHNSFKSSGYDLGIFDQSIWLYSVFSMGPNTVRNVPTLLADHFHPILILVAPLYWIWSDVRVLLLLQAILLASAIPAIYCIALAKLNKNHLAALLFSAAYALFWGTGRAAGYDFHEIAFAVPLIAWSFVFLQKERWGLIALSLGALLLVKENMGLVVAAFGIYFFITRRPLWLGLGAMLVGLLTTLILTRYLIPALGDGTYAYWPYTALGSNPQELLTFIVTHPAEALRQLVDHSVKRRTLLALLASTGFLSLASPAFIIAIPMILERFWSNNLSHWAVDFHYSAVIAPVLFFGAIDSIARISAYLPHRKNTVIVLLSAMVLCTSLAITWKIKIPQEGLADSTFYSEESLWSERSKELPTIPNSARIVAQDAIVPHFSHRRAITPLRFDREAVTSFQTDYIIAHPELSPWPQASWKEINSYIEEAKTKGFTQVITSGGWIILKKE